MESAAIQTLLQQHFADAEIEVTVEGSHVNLIITSEQFDGLSTLKRQQSVYGALAEQIASGEIHAVNMKTLTPQETAG